VRRQRGTIYFTDSQVVLVKPKDGVRFQLDELQKAVQGYIEQVPALDRSTTVWANEESWLQEPVPPPNPHAQSVVAVDKVLTVDGTIRGNMIGIYTIKPDEDANEVDKGRVTVEEAYAVRG